MSMQLWSELPIGGKTEQETTKKNLTDIHD